LKMRTVVTSELGICQSIKQQLNTADSQSDCQSIYKTTEQADS